MSDAGLADFNQQVIEEFRSNGGVVGGPFAGAPMVLLTHTGARTGTQRTTPLVYTRDGDRVVVVASMGGAPRNPQWLHNLEANPRVKVEIGTEAFEAVAEVLTDGPERQRLFDAQAAAMPNFRDYQQRTTRVIPVVVLTPV